jgi:hypothetical protein
VQDTDTCKYQTLLDTTDAAGSHRETHCFPRQSPVIFVSQKNYRKDRLAVYVCVCTSVHVSVCPFPYFFVIYAVFVASNVRRRLVLHRTSCFKLKRMKSTFIRRDIVLKVFSHYSVLPSLQLKWCVNKKQKNERMRYVY